MDQQKINTYDYIFKVIFLGCASVGKTALLTRFCDDIFTDSYQSTIGIDFRIKTIKYGDQTIKIQIWDTAGQERYQSIASTHYKGTDGVFCVYDVANKESFEKVKENIIKCTTIVAVPEDCIVIVGNKCDLPMREIDREKGEELAKMLKASYYETSAKTGENVPIIFQELCKNIINNKKILEGVNPHNDRQNLSVEKQGDLIKNKSECNC